MRAQLTWLILVVGSVALGGCAAEDARDDAAADTADLAAELAEELTEAEQQIDDLVSELDAVQDELAHAEAALADAESHTPESDGIEEGVSPPDVIGEALGKVGATGGDASGMLNAQLHALLHTDEAMAQPTDWAATTNPAAEDFIGERVITPQQGARDLSDEVFPGYAGQERWATTMRFDERDDETVATVLTWGLKDDAVAGHDLRISMIPAQQGWEVADVEERSWCRRGVTDDGLCW